MYEASVIIPNYNGGRFLRNCMNSLLKQSDGNFETILVDNGSTDDSLQVMADYSWVRVISLTERVGFGRAVNEGIAASHAPYVIVLACDTEAEEDFVKELLRAVKRSSRMFSCQAKIIRGSNPGKIENGGLCYNSFGWIFVRGRGKSVRHYDKRGRIFAASAAASVYRKAVFREIGLFDEELPAGLADLDMGYRARIYGYSNTYEPQAAVSRGGINSEDFSGWRLRTRNISCGNISLLYRNMPFFQFLLNLPFLLSGFLVKTGLFLAGRLGKEYFGGIFRGFMLCRKEKKVEFEKRNILNYMDIQLELWKNMFRMFTG